MIVVRKYIEMASEDQDCATFNKTYSDEMVKRFRQGYYASLSYADYELGRVLDVCINSSLQNNM